MKVLYITAGAAGMYCGSCLRDNALAAELMAQGHDVTLLPLYTPTLTDEANVSYDRVFFGGISVYLQQQSAVFRHTPRVLDRIWDSKAALRAASRGSLAVDPQALSAMTISILRGEDGNQGKEFFKLLDWLAQQDPPDIVSLPNALLIALAGPIRQLFNRPVCVTLQGEDLFLAGLPEPHRTTAIELIKANVANVDGFIALNNFYAEFMSDYLSIPREQIHVVPLGINLTDYDTVRPQIDSAKRFAASERFTIGYFARIAPEKGLHLLAQAYRLLRSKGELGDARLEAAGYLAPEYRGYLRAIEDSLKEAGLGNEFRYHGTLERHDKIEFLRGLDVFSMPATYPEPKGLSVIEAMASSVPVVQPRWGAFPEMIHKTSGGILVEPNDTGSLAEGLLSLWKNQEYARDLGRQAGPGVRANYTVEMMTDRAVEVYADIVHGFRQ
ncbi:MAG: glycosyltransferase family 4 protein [Acidobacteriota bacterium]